MSGFQERKVVKMVSKNLLTEQDEIAYSVISKFIKENGYPPSVRELCKIMGKSSTATIKYRLKSLEKKGFIKTTSGAKRTIRLLNEVEQGRCDWCKTYEGGWEWKLKTKD
jgi:SOS-response transcriptional repressor LexA